MTTRPRRCPCRDGGTPDIPTPESRESSRGGRQGYGICLTLPLPPPLFSADKDGNGTITTCNRAGTVHSTKRRGLTMRLVAVCFSSGRSKIFFFDWVFPVVSCAARTQKTWRIRRIIDHFPESMPIQQLFPGTFRPGHREILSHSSRHHSAIGLFPVFTDYRLQPNRYPGACTRVAAT